MTVGVGVGSGVGATVGVGVRTGVGSGVGAAVAVGVGASVGVGSRVSTEVVGLSSQAESSAIETKHSANSVADQILSMKNPISAT